MLQKECLNYVSKTLREVDFCDSRKLGVQTCREEVALVQPTWEDRRFGARLSYSSTLLSPSADICSSKALFQRLVSDSGIEF